MNRLKIADISFCEVECATQAQIMGGTVTFGGSTGYSAWVSSYDSAYSSSYFAYVDNRNGVIAAAAGSSYSGSAAGAAAGAAGDGYTSVYAYAGAYTS